MTILSVCTLSLATCCLKLGLTLVLLLFVFSIQVPFLHQFLVVSITTKAQQISVDISWLRGYPLTSPGGSQVLPLYHWFTAVLLSPKSHELLSPNNKRYDITNFLAARARHYISQNEKCHRYQGWTIHLLGWEVSLLKGLDTILLMKGSVFSGQARLL